MVGRSDMSKFTEWSRQGSFTVNNERAVRTLKPSSEQKKCFERIPSRPTLGARAFSCAVFGFGQAGRSSLRVSLRHVLHKLRKKRARKTSVAQTDYSKITFHTITISVSLVTSYESCLACQHLIQIGLITNCVRN